MGHATARVREILLATDFSDASESAVEVARTYVRLLGARVHLLHVTTSEERGLTPLLAGLAETFAPAPTVIRSLPGGSPAHEIVTYACENKIDLIILGTHGRSGMSRALLGSVAERVVRTAPCPVLTVSATAIVPPSVSAVEEPEARPCVVCGKRSQDLICEPCRAHIRGHLLEQKQREERAGRR